VLRPIRVGDRRCSAELVPAESFRISFEIDFPNSPVGEQAISVDLDEDVFAEEFSSARTFGFARDLEKLWSSGLAKGGSLANAIVVGDDGVLNEGGLRYQDEFVRHKVLDALGDLYLAGAPILGHFRGFRSGHAMHAKLLQALFSEPSAWRVEVREEAETETEAWPRRAAL
jgi:UDP-3-O-[3-hydroxymyristoyl] N-acetylglucosamine deacetylase